MYGLLKNVCMTMFLMFLISNLIPYEHSVYIMAYLKWPYSILSAMLIHLCSKTFIGFPVELLGPLVAAVNVLSRFKVADDIGQ